MACAKCEVFVTDDNKSCSVIADFTNGRLRDYENVRFQLYQTTRKAPATKRKLVAETDRLLYTSKTNRSTTGLRYLVGVFDEKTKKMKLQSTQLYSLKPHWSEKDSDDNHENEPQTHRQKLDDLTSTFGSSKRKKAMVSRHKNAIKGEALQVSVGAAVEQAIVQSDMNSANSAETKQEASTVIPKYNKDATTPADVYLLDDIIGAQERESLLTPAQKFIDSTKEDHVEWRKSNLYCSFVGNQLSTLPHDPEQRATKCCLLMYLHYMFTLYGFRAKDLRTKGLPKFPVDLPLPVRKDLLNRYTTVTLDGNKRETRCMGREKRDKLLAHILVLCLIIEEYNLELSLLQKDLKLGAMKLDMMLKNLGCKIQTQKIPSGILSETVELKTATLSVPLTFPDMKVKARKRRR